MKTLITSILALTVVALSPVAEARPVHRGHVSASIHIGGYRSCGTPIYHQRYIAGYDCHGRPVWRTRVVAQPHQYRHRARPVRIYRPRPCPPPIVRRCVPVRPRHCRY